MITKNIYFKETIQWRLNKIWKEKLQQNKLFTSPGIYKKNFALMIFFTSNKLTSFFFDFHVKFQGYATLLAGFIVHR